MRDLAMRVVLLWGWRRALGAVLAGALGALAMPPLGILPALVVSLTLAVWLIDGSTIGRTNLGYGTLRSAFVTGWCFGFGYFLAGLWWLGAAFIVDSDEFLWALPLGVIGLPAGLALFHAFGFLLARLLWSERASRVLALAFGLGVSEWLRGTILTGFPWIVYGQAFGGSDILAQTASLVGVHGLTVLAVAIAAAPAAVATGLTAWPKWRPLLAAGAVLILMAGHGFWRLRGDEGFAPNAKLRIMQPNISQREKNRPGVGADILARYLALSDRATGPGAMGLSDVTHLIWPESPFPFVLAREPEALARIASALTPSRTMLLTGAIRMEPATSTSGQRYFNALQVVGADGRILASYDKTHLVPFGEYLPFQQTLTRLGLRQFVHVPGGFEAGTRRGLIQVAGLPLFAPLICYEAIFPAGLWDGAGRPGLLLNITNDGWFGQTIGPHQHLAQARLRAIEQGLPLVRAANTGISAVVDSRGRVLASLPLGLAGVLDTRLPLAAPATPYSWWGDGALLVLLLIALVGSRSRSSAAVAVTSH